MNFKNIIKKSFLFSLIGCSISTFGLIPKNDILSQGFGLNLLTKFTAKAEFKSGKNKLLSKYQKQKLTLDIDFFLYEDYCKLS